MPEQSIIICNLFLSDDCIHVVIQQWISNGPSLQDLGAVWDFSTALPPIYESHAAWHCIALFIDGSVSSRITLTIRTKPPGLTVQHVWLVQYCFWSLTVGSEVMRNMGTTESLTWFWEQHIVLHYSYFIAFLNGFHCTAMLGLILYTMWWCSVPCLIQSCSLSIFADRRIFWARQLLRLLGVNHVEQSTDIAYLSSTVFSTSLYYEVVLSPACFVVRDAACVDWFIVHLGPCWRVGRWDWTFQLPQLLTLNRDGRGTVSHYLSAIMFSNGYLYKQHPTPHDSLNSAVFLDWFSTAFLPSCEDPEVQLTLSPWRAGECIVLSVF